jgi:DMSO/TMAO reductase YedYZ molybdopterin-dependent catalytic subunit
VTQTTCDPDAPTGLSAGRVGRAPRAVHAPISRGFSGRRRQADATRLPPGQYLVRDFPVLSAGPTPHTGLDEWTFLISGDVDQPVSWTWEELLALPAETPSVDIHCVTKWSKLDTRWKGVSVDTLLENVETAAEYVTAWCDGGYTRTCRART